MPSLDQHPSGYGTDDSVKLVKSVVYAGQRRRMDLLSILQNLFAPWLMFSLLYAVLSFFPHFRYPLYTDLFAIACLLAALFCGWKAFQAWRAKHTSEDTDPTWYIFLLVQMLIAWGLAMFLGNLNFTLHMHQYYDWANMSYYPNVDPAMIDGQQVMDGGRVVFSRKAGLDLRLAVAFKNDDIYCAAPIAVPDTSLGTYDFWAVGKNCCTGDGKDFHCQNFDNPRAHAGLRLLRDDERPFFRLAVQQAEAMYQIQAFHPLFFHFVEDPTVAMDEYRYEGFRWFMTGMFAFFTWCLLCVALAAWRFQKLGYY